MTDATDDAARDEQPPAETPAVTAEEEVPPGGAAEPETAAETRVADEPRVEEVVDETRQAASDAREAVASREFPVAERAWDEPAGARAGAVARRVGPVVALVALGWLVRQFVRRRRTRRG
ncbi:MAG: hypothetical protein ACRD29_19560 [Acidimicrobiales bacterium]